MNERALRILEYDKIIALLCAEADSAPGRAQCERLMPMSDIHEVRDALEAIGTQSGRPREEVRFTIEVVSKRNHVYSVKKN